VDEAPVRTTREIETGAPPDVVWSVLNLKREAERRAGS